MSQYHLQNERNNCLYINLFYKMYNPIMCSSVIFLLLTGSWDLPETALGLTRPSFLKYLCRMLFRGLWILLKPYQSMSCSHTILECSRGHVRAHPFHVISGGGGAGGSMRAHSLFSCSLLKLCKNGVCFRE